MAESAAGVLLRAPRSLHDTIKTDELASDYSHLSLHSSKGSNWNLTASTNNPRPFRQSVESFLRRRVKRILDPLIEPAQDRWRTVNAPQVVALVRASAKFERSQVVERPAGSGGDRQVA
jgi:hypothetical protein